MGYTSNGGALPQPLSGRDWDAEFAKAQGLLKEFAEDDALKRLFSEACGYFDSATKAYNLSLFPQVEHFLALVEETRTHVAPTRYFYRLERLGIGTREIKHGDPKEAEKWWEDLGISSLRRILCILAMCIDVAKKDFPQLSIRGGVTEAKEEFGGKVPFLYVEGTPFYLFTIPTRMEFDIGIRKNADCLFVVMKIAAGGAFLEYTFSGEDMRPFALAKEKSQERFVVPDVIEEMAQDRENISVLYGLAVVAAALGLIDLVCSYAGEIVKQKTRWALKKQGIEGEFLSDSDQEKLSDARSLLTDLRKALSDQQKSKVATFPPNGEFLDWLHRFRTISVKDVIPDISFHDGMLDEILLYRAQILEARRRYSRTKDVQYDFTCFLLVGPWALKLEVPCEDPTFRRELVKALNHRVVKRKSS